VCWFPTPTDRRRLVITRSPKGGAAISAPPGALSKRLLRCTRNDGSFFLRHFAFYYPTRSELANSQVDRPLVPVTAGVIREAEPLPPSNAAEFLHVDRGSGTSALGDQGTRPFEMIWPRAGA
jgi:hypothetical protein